MSAPSGPSAGNASAPVYGNVSRETLKSTKGLDLLQGMIDGRYPAPPIAEDLEDDPLLTTPTGDGGAGFNAQWDAGFIRRIRPQLVAHDDAERDMGAVVAGTDAAGYLRALWTLHVTKQLEPADYARALEHPAEEVRGWAVQLGTEQVGLR